MSKQGIVVILARGGSKGVPRKNLALWKGIPLVAHPIRAAKVCFASGRIYVSTDDDEIAAVAEAEGVRVVKRPWGLSQDTVPDWPAMDHLVRTIEGDYDYVVHLRATFPAIRPAHISAAVDQLVADWDGYDSLRSVVRAKQSPYKMWRIDDQGRLSPVVPGHEMHSMPRQVVPPAYWQNAAIDVIKTWTIVQLRSMTGDRVMPFLMDPGDGVDVDTLEDLRELERKS